MNIIDFVEANIDPIEDGDIRNAYYMRDLMGEEYYELTPLSRVSLSDSFIRSIDTFKLYKNNTLVNNIDDKKRKTYYVPLGSVPFYFNMQIMVGKNGNVVPTIIHPNSLDEASYAFFGHEFHHVLKDTNIKERKIRDRVAEVIPMFYEIMCADKEENDEVAKEIVKRRMFLLQMDSEEEENVRQLQYFNSYYYALALYHKYKVGDNKILILRLVTRVLNGEISTLELLEMLDLYNSDLDYTVSWELEMIRKYIRD